MQRAAATAGEGPKFVWTKKVEKELVGGKKVKELSAFCDKDRHVERLVSWDHNALSHKLSYKLSYKL